MGIENGLGREDDRVLARFPGLEQRVKEQKEFGARPSAIAGSLNVHYRTNVFGERWVESIIRRLDRDKRKP
jgi:hypothetical protein